MDALYAAGPDDPIEFRVNFRLDAPRDPKILGVIECAANLNVFLKVIRPDLESDPSRRLITIIFTGQASEIAALDMMMNDWRDSHGYHSPPELSK
jgi:hypothetical protein